MPSLPTIRSLRGRCFEVNTSEVGPKLAIRMMRLPVVYVPAPEVRVSEVNG